MPYYIYIVTGSETGTSKSVTYVSEFDNFKAAKTEVRRLRIESPLETSQGYKVMFAEDRAEAEKQLTEHREQPIAKEWEK
ncbi:MAG TPA: hypothetical protein VET88_08560 [Gammaproteobacteria bacterium]|nr:hypothetical protein [Gammaproteobacteria bacterium]